MIAFYLKEIFFLYWSFIFLRFDYQAFVFFQSHPLIGDST
jgi:hypothetical protein